MQLVITEHYQLALLVYDVGLPSSSWISPLARPEADNLFPSAFVRAAVIGGNIFGCLWAAESGQTAELPLGPK